MVRDRVHSLREHLDAVLDALDKVAETRVVWEGGLMHPGGPHRRLRGMISPISIGEDECLVFGRLVEAFRPKTAFVIGNAFGLSAAYIARVMEAHGGESIVTLDSQAEGDGARCAAVAQALADALGLRILTCKKGGSPEDVPAVVAAPMHDLIFIDGLHAHPQVTLDLDACLPFSDDRTVFVWHDHWIPGVPESVQVARSRGFGIVWIPTSCEMAVGARDPAVVARLREVFPEGLGEPFARSGKGMAGVAKLMARFSWDRLRGAE